MADNLLQKVDLSSKSIDDYSVFIPDVVNKVKRKALQLKGLKVTHINATAQGGGVAEMLYSVVPLQRDLGLDSNWYVIPPNEKFFEVTKSIHNFLQGKEGSLNKENKQAYLNHNKLIATLLDQISTDILIIHDPQPAAMIAYIQNKPKNCIWRCHIDTSTPNESVWGFLYPYLAKYDRYVFTMKDFVHKGLDSRKVNFITPVIDPLSPKNLPMAKDEARSRLQKMGLDMTKPLITQVSRLDPWKDPKGVIDAFNIAKKEIPTLQLAFVAQMATDDPEGVLIAQEVKDYAAGSSDIHFFINLKDNDRMVNAFQVASDVMLQKSTREGFALTVTEAMWKGAVVVAGNVGGIRLQIKDGQNGFLTSSIQETADKIVFTLKNPKKMASLSMAARESVKTNYLMPHLLLNYFNLFSKLI